MVRSAADVVNEFTVFLFNTGPAEMTIGELKKKLEGMVEEYAQLCIEDGRQDGYSEGYEDGISAALEGDE